MLNDGRRNRAFARAIERDVTRGDRCVDVGAGAGILAAMLARACGREGGVVAVEEYAPSRFDDGAGGFRNAYGTGAIA